jgi:hypothetical protein
MENIRFRSSSLRGGEIVSFEDSLAIVGRAASARFPDCVLEEQRILLVENALSAARAASAALHVWAGQCLSEYRGSRTTWDLHATTELLAATLAQFQAQACDAAARVVELLPEIRAATATQEPSDAPGDPSLGDSEC